MNRHLLVGRFGAADDVPVAAGTGEVVTELQFVAAKKRFDYGIGDVLDHLKGLNIFPTEVAVDLMILAGLLHAADTRISRATESQDCWTREIRLVVPVSDPSLWNSVTSILQSMLNFLTGDKWQFTFRVRPEGFARTVAERPLFHEPPAFDGVSLFSGGLDSLIAAINALEEGRNPIFVSHAGEGAVSKSQKNVFSFLEDVYSRELSRVRLPMKFRKNLVANSRVENSTRGRSFLFFSLAVLIGSSFSESCCVEVPENGLIALNVPLDQLRLGSLSTRTTHPFYISQWNELLKALSLHVTVDNPYWNQTKGEMVETCRNRDVLDAVLPLSLSCSSPTKARWLGHSAGHCGFCLPCLIRRAALEKGLGGADPTTYTVSDLKAELLKTSKAQGLQVRSFQMAIQRLQARPELAELLIHKSGPLSQESDARQAELAGVYLRGMMEVAELLEGVETEP